MKTTTDTYPLSPRAQKALESLPEDAFEKPGPFTLPFRICDGKLNELFRIDSHGRTFVLGQEVSHRALGEFLRGFEAI